MPDAAAGNINIVLSVNKANYTAAMAEAHRQLDVFAGKAAATGKTTASSMIAGSAAAKELSGHFENNTRGAVKFPTTLPGVGNALKAAFPLIGGLAFAGMLVGIGTQIAEFVKKANAMPQAIREGFAALNLEQKASIDSTVVLTDKLISAHNAFLHISDTDNATKTALDEATESADKFAAACVAANAKVQELLDKNSSGIFMSLITGQTYTGAVEKEFKTYQQKQATSSYNLANATTDADRAKAQKELDDKLAAFIKDQRDPSKENPGGKLAYRQAQGGAVAADAEGLLTNLLNQQNAGVADKAHAAAEGQGQKDEATKKAAEQAKEAAAKQLEAQKKAMQDALDAMKADHQVSVGETLAYWDKQVAATTKGTELYRFALGHMGEANQECYRWLQEAGKQLDEDAKKKADAIARWDEMALRLIDESDEQAEHMAAAQAKLDEANAKNTFELDALTRAHDLATGAITKHDAATQEMADHTAEYAAQLTALQNAKTALTQKDIDDGKGKDIDAQIANVTVQAAPPSKATSGTSPTRPLPVGSTRLFTSSSRHRRTQPRRCVTL